MRVISGKYRGKKLKEFELNTTKPTTDRVKESIFNLIQFDVMDAVVLDLFAGTGALGIEAISRGAKKTYLVDNNLQAISIIKDNTKNFTEDFEVVNKSALEFLNTTKTKFDIILLDPPYKSNFGMECINYIINNNLLNENGIIIFETARDLNFDFNHSNFKLTTHNYGTVAVHKLVKL